MIPRTHKLHFVAINLAVTPEKKHTHSYELSSFYVSTIDEEEKVNGGMNGREKKNGFLAAFISIQFKLSKL